jgi:leucyl aminopeptidase
MTDNAGRATFDATPSLRRVAAVQIGIAPVAPASAGTVGYLVAVGGDVPAGLGLGRSTLEAAGFDAAAGSALVVPTADGPAKVAVGIGGEALDAATVRNAAAAFARAAAKQSALAIELGDVGGMASEVAAQAVVEGVLLARYSYESLRREPKGAAVSELTLVADADRHDALRVGAERGRALAAATQLARDLANTPHSHLNATRFAEVASGIGAERGLEVEVFDKAALTEMGCGGLLGVNQGSRPAA